MMGQVSSAGEVVGAGAHLALVLLSREGDRRALLGGVGEELEALHGEAALLQLLAHLDAHGASCARHAHTWLAHAVLRGRREGGSARAGRADLRVHAADR